MGIRGVTRSVLKHCTGVKWGTPFTEWNHNNVSNRDLGGKDFVLVFSARPCDLDSTTGGARMESNLMLDILALDLLLPRYNTVFLMVRSDRGREERTQGCDPRFHSSVKERLCSR